MGERSATTAGARQRLADLKPDLAAILERLDGVVLSGVADFNALVAAKELPALIVPKEESIGTRGEPGIGGIDTVGPAGHHRATRHFQEEG